MHTLVVPLTILTSCMRKQELEREFGLVFVKTTQHSRKNWRRSNRIRLCVFVVQIRVVFDSSWSTCVCCGFVLSQPFLIQFEGIEIEIRNLKLNFEFDRYTIFIVDIIVS